MANDEKSVFSQRLKLARQQADMSQAELAEKANITPSTISAYENQGKYPALNFALRIAKALDVSIDWLCGYVPSNDVSKCVSSALMQVLNELNPHIDLEKDKQGYTVPKLIFGLNSGDINEAVRENMVSFLNGYKAILTISEQDIPYDFAEHLEELLIEEYKNFKESPQVRIATKTSQGYKKA